MRRRLQDTQRDIPDVNDRLARLESLLGDVFNRLSVPPAPATARTGPAQPPERDDVSESLYTGSDSSSIFRTVRDFLDTGRREPRPIHVPTPVRAGPSFDEQLAELIASGPPADVGTVQQPPPLVPLIYRPGPRIGRPPSASPTFETDLPPRRGTFPQTERVVFDRPPGPRLRPMTDPVIPPVVPGLPTGFMPGRIGRTPAIPTFPERLGPTPSPDFPPVIPEQPDNRRQTIPVIPDIT